MTKEELKAVRTRFDVAENLINELHTVRLGYDEYLTLIDSAQDIPALLKYITALKSEMTEIDRNSAGKDAEYKRELQRLESERDKAIQDNKTSRNIVELTRITLETENNRSKKYIEAFERAIKHPRTEDKDYDYRFVLCMACYTCTHKNDSKDLCRKNCRDGFTNWQFDESRFSKAGDGGE